MKVSRGIEVFVEVGIEEAIEVGVDVEELVVDS